MKRINPKTNKPYRRGDIREDGKVFLQFFLKRPLSKDGFYKESWCSWEFYNTKKKKENEWAKQNKTLIFKNIKTYKLKNPNKILAYGAKRRAGKLKATPPWLTNEQKQNIEALYEMAKMLEKIFPWKQHVDHIIPLSGKNVSGLHVPWNLQILSAAANMAKSNKLLM